MISPLLIASISGILLLLMGGYAAFKTLSAEKKRKSQFERRLAINPTNKNRSNVSEQTDEEQLSATTTDVFAKQALKLVTGDDKEKVARLRRMLIRAGEFDPAAPATFVLRRFTLMAAAFVLAIGYSFMTDLSLLTPKAVMVIGGASIVGYFIPSLMLFHKTRQRLVEYRNGFPDFMDLMIVCADAGLSLEASIERVARELTGTYPSLSHNLSAFSVELRAGKNINDAMRSFGDRVGLDEVDAFAVLLKQSRELGTSLSGTLRVYSEEMRDKRMMLAEEKAHALPAKMTIPVTMCILPTVVMIAIIPVIVKMGME